MRKKFMAACVAATVGLSGCASILSESRYPVSINSNTPDAVVVVKNRSGVEMHRATTPAMVTLPAGDGFFRKAKYTMEFEKDGYVGSTQNLEPSMDGWYVGNILFGGLIGLLIVDPATGAMWKLPEMAHGSLVLDPQYQAAEDQGAEAQGKSAVDRLRDIKDLHDNGILSTEEYEAKKAELLEEI
ncbi:SHOCT domain-containing protein [Alcanivorax sp. 1008]|uniref:SHOCT domain-containing protein n=1 Tax=Alcanivorax sp. 1008 TaxID=2816853 RepID=UPI001D829568|nr:SHOCT domain-containing protein [Alcanivorax sp. 1008]MCC1495997.1 SHOCT domain-containing protein [Alcanivorax sp. 1008]